MVGYQRKTPRRVLTSAEIEAQTQMFLGIGSGLIVNQEAGEVLDIPPPLGFSFQDETSHFPSLAEEFAKCFNGKEVH